MNVASLMVARAQEEPDLEAVILAVDRTCISYKELDQGSNYLGRFLLDSGLEPGDRCLLFVKPSLEFSIITFSLLKAGIVPVLIDPGIGRPALLRAISKVAPKGLIAVALVHYLRLLYPKVFASVKVAISSSSWAPRSLSAQVLRCARDHTFPPLMYDSDPDVPAAVVFTSGGTGPPRGVLVSHRNFMAQVEILQAKYGFKAEERDLAAFPLFSLLTICMGVSSVIPDMDPSRPAEADPESLWRTINDLGVHTAAGSPAIWQRLRDYCFSNDLVLPLRGLMMFGAPVARNLLSDCQQLMPKGEVYTPYGASECLPVSNGSAKDLVKTQEATAAGAGICLGRSLDSLDLKIVALSKEAWQSPADWQELGVGEVGEIVVRGPQVTRAYYDDPEATAAVKVPSPEGLWHRMGDLGYLDSDDCLWFCGRKAHRVVDNLGRVFDSACCEGVFNQNEHFLRTALVSWRGAAAMVLEGKSGDFDLGSLRAEFLSLGSKAEQTLPIDTFFLSPQAFPVDRRHNIKIDRLQLGKLCREAWIF